MLALAPPPRDPSARWRRLSGPGCDDWLRVGEASNPGPEHDLNIASVNVTALMPSVDAIASVQCDAYALQEHALAPGWLQPAANKCGAAGLSLHASPAFMCGDKATAGVGIAVKSPGAMHRPSAH